VTFEQAIFVGLTIAFGMGVLACVIVRMFWRHRRRGPREPEPAGVDLRGAPHAHAVPGLGHLTTARSIPDGPPNLSTAESGLPRGHVSVLHNGESPGVAREGLAGALCW